MEEKIKSIVENYYCTGGDSCAFIGGCEKCKDDLKKELEELVGMAKADAIDEFIRFIFGRNVIHNRRFTTREEEHFLNMAEQFKERLKEKIFKQLKKWL